MMFEILSEFSEFIKEDPYMVVISFVITIVSLILAIISVTKKDKPKISITTETLELISDNIPKIKKITLLYDNVELSKLSVSKVRIQNIGRIAIQNSMFYENKKLELMETTGGKILDAEVVYSSSDTISAKINDDNIIEFDTFEEKDYIEIIAYHTNEKDVSSKVKIAGKIRDGVIRDYNETYTSKMLNSYYFFNIIPILMMIVVLSVSDKSEIFYGDVGSYLFSGYIVFALSLGLHKFYEIHKKINKDEFK